MYGEYFIYPHILVGPMIAGALWGIALMLPLGWLGYSKLQLKNTRELVEQVLNSKPGLDIENWDTVASKLNLFFYKECIWKTPYFFFNGQQVQLLFKDKVLKSYLQGKFDDLTDADKIQSARYYQQSVKEKFESSLKDSLPEFLSESELPRDTPRGKFFFYPGYVLLIFLVCVLQGQALFMILRSVKEKSFLPLGIVIYDQYMFFACYRNVFRIFFPAMSTLRAINFLAVIKKVSPGKELDKWDRVARYMNQYLAEEKAGHSNEKFFDGKHCLKYYKTFFEPLSTGSKCLDHAELKEIVEVTQPYVD